VETIIIVIIKEITLTAVTQAREPKWVKPGHVSGYFRSALRASSGYSKVPGLVEWYRLEHVL